MAEPLPSHIGNIAGSGKPVEQLLTGKIRVDYNVSMRGRVRNIRTEAIPEEFTDMQRIVHREIRRRIFRPKMVAGEMQLSENLVFEHSFFYRQSDLDKLKRPTEQSESQPADGDTET
jgi:hypothetical protein